MSSSQQFSNGEFILHSLHVSVVRRSSSGSTQITENPSLTTDPLLLEYLSYLLTYICTQWSSIMTV
jgi:hypothetical protein